MICAKGVSGQDGNTYLVLDPTVQDLTTCQYVVETAGELANGLPLNLSLQDGTQLGFMLLLPLATAWTFKQVARVIGASGNVAEPEE